jgi:N-acetylglucosamine kinase-like BadF-type ATPase
MKYVIGVEGGNTRTQYHLFSEDGASVDLLVDGTCSREAIGEDGAFSVLGTRVKQLLRRNHLDVQDVGASVFGLAGVDTKEHEARFHRFLSGLGLEKCVVTNDSLLGVFSGTSAGVGICTINGSGCVTGGIDLNGARMQIGGLGDETGDDGGTHYIARQGVRAVYDRHFRLGNETLMGDALFSLYGIAEPEELARALDERADERFPRQIVQIVFAAAGMDDAPALQILNHVGYEMARNAASLMRKMSLPDEPEIVLAGEIWHMDENQTLLSAYKRHLCALAGDRARVSVLTSPLALGAVCWAFALHGSAPLSAVRERAEGAIHRRLAGGVA